MFERLLEPGCTESPACYCGGEMHIAAIEMLPQGSDAAVRIYHCDECQREMRLTVWAAPRCRRRRDAERIGFGTQGADSPVRHVDLASVDTAALVAPLDQEANTPRRRLPFLRRIIVRAQRSSVF
jgi:hypothetical protein